ncbi:hypothetical protein LTR70_006051 [Exophiala xenobiotica]|uniref:Uncharacterized protein n=1 Tax=Lithohypha guttulata TaxID=1690604 RepID=A0ABR0KFI1_9EURO|nr:hypothetical protein LTR24_003292 [Lithohypha guttulata]KAK5316918.1 hypothetical protein LTR70_006051 [Exophiala xenobiotica]
MFANKPMSAEQAQQDKECPMNKRRRFAPNMLPVIASTDNSELLHQTCESPLLYQLCEQAPSEQEIEAQLLQVGMRIRKAVSEGYQNTSDTLAALSAPKEDDANFSAGGLHNVGAMAMQPLSTATFCGINIAMMSHISSSTPVEEQKLWSYSTASKRRNRFDDESDSDDSQEFMPQTPQLEYADAGMAIPQDYFNIDIEGTSEVRPMKQDGGPRAKSHNRRMAQPKSRLGGIPEQPLPTINPFAQIAPSRSSFGHQRMRSCGVEAMMDFGEASFLQPRQDIEMDCS